MKHAIYPGSFDPVTYGHIDIIKRAAEMFDDLTVCVLDNKAKTPLFSVDERVKMLRKVSENIPNVHVDSYYGLLMDYARKINCHIAVRGLRAVTDFEYELQIAHANRTISDLYHQQHGICLSEFFRGQGDRIIRGRHKTLRSAQY